jgi:nanoRNase/pAp phosphatase (c-di-AMP/oligoRNAs hydrolase)
VNDALQNDRARREGGHVRLGDFLLAHQGERHLIVLQDYPDPDAISSAFAYQLIASNYAIEADVTYGGKISHPQNIALVRLLNFQLVPFDETLDPSRYQGAVFLDNQGTTAVEVVQALEADKISTLVVIDHHEPQNSLAAEYVDIQRTGATATIFAQLLEGGLFQLDRSQNGHTRVATALLHGILTDTGDFSRARSEDFDAAAYLSRFSNSDLLSQIMSQSRSKQVMSIIHQALENRVTVESFSIAGVGYLKSEDRDVIPQAADFLLTEENVHSVIVYGIVAVSEQEEKVIGSMRTSKMTTDTDGFIKDVFGKDAKGRYFGGGKLSAGGFEIPVGFLSGGELEDYQDIKWKVYDNQIKQKVFAKIGFNPST